MAKMPSTVDKLASKRKCKSCGAFASAEGPGALSVFSAPAAVAPAPPAVHSGAGELGYIPTLAEVEAAHIEAVLQQLGGNKSRAARALGISREGLRVKLGAKDGTC